MDYHTKVKENKDLKTKLNSSTINADLPNFEKSGAYFNQIDSLLKEVQNIKAKRNKD